jgi:transmembrane sensor
MDTPDWSLIARYLSGEAKENEKSVVADWLRKDESNAELLGRLQKLLRPNQDIPDFNKSLESDWEHILQKRSKRTPRALPLMSPFVLKIAASILIFVSVGLSIWKLGFDSINASTHFIAVDSVKHLVLPDSSSIWLNKNSSIIVSGDFNEAKREVELHGEAYFEIARNVHKPFIVHSHAMETTVLGTAFNILEKDDSITIITVSKGKVSVENSRNTFLSILLRGDVLHHNNSLNQFTKTQNDDLNFLSWKTGVIRFESASLGEVCKYLSKYYNVHIAAERNLNKLKITTTFDNLSLNQSIQVISTTLELKIVRKGTDVFLTK